MLLHCTLAAEMSRFFISFNNIGSVWFEIFIYFYWLGLICVTDFIVYFLVMCAAVVSYSTASLCISFRLAGMLACRPTSQPEIYLDV